MRALEEGHATLSVQILGAYHSEIAPATIDLTIVIPFVIHPKNIDATSISESKDGVHLYSEIIRICPTSEFKLELKTQSKSESSGLTLTSVLTPSRKYLWNIDESQSQLG